MRARLTLDNPAEPPNEIGGALPNSRPALTGSRTHTSPIQIAGRFDQSDGFDPADLRSNNVVPGERLIARRLTVGHSAPTTRT